METEVNRQKQKTAPASALSPLQEQLRDMFAAAAISGIATHDANVNVEHAVRRAYMVADVMLTLRGEKR